ncbi:hypothetical protein J4G37_11735 [Microvirga sp. 3-52]|nr:hypothetical protein [Microvirga sp. 3-52]
MITGGRLLLSPSRQGVEGRIGESGSVLRNTLDVITGLVPVIPIRKA